LYLDNFGIYQFKGRDVGAGKKSKWKGCGMVEGMGKTFHPSTEIILELV
jgi:hypothetical protein